MKEQEINIEAVDRFQQAHSARIDKLFWVAGSMDNRDFVDFIQYMTDEELKDLFPELKKVKTFADYREGEEDLQLLVDHNKFGFVAEVHIPEAYQFRFEKGSKKPKWWGVNSAVCKIKYAYAETTDGLLKQIEILAEECFQYDLKNSLNKATA